MRKPKVLWLSRHDILPAQFLFLEQTLGGFEIVFYHDPVSTADDAVRLVKEHKADYVVPILPLSFIVRLVEKAREEGFTVLRPEMELIHNCERQPCPEYDRNADTIIQSRDYTTGKTVYRHYRFKEFVKIKDIKIITEPL